MSSVRKSAWKKVQKGSSGLQIRVQNLVRKFRPERVRWQLRCFLSSVTDSKNRPDISVGRQQEGPTTFDVDHLAATSKSNGCQRISDDEYEPEIASLSASKSSGGLCHSHIADTHQKLMSTEFTTSSEGESGRPRPNDLALNIPSVIIESVSDGDRGRSSSLLCTPSPSHTPRNKSPVTVQEWVDSLPLTPVDSERAEEETLSEDQIINAIIPETDDILTLGAEASLMCGANPPAVQVTSCREPSETGSICSSVESLLEARKPDPEEILLGLGFGGPTYAADTGRVPQRFLQPSKLKGVTIDDFLKQQQEMVQTFESGFCGYRGLTGPSHTMPSVIVAKIMEKLREHERENLSIGSPPRASDPKNTTSPNKNKFSRVARNVLTKIRCVPGSVLTPDNRKWLDSQGDKSPEISRKRIIIGQQSFTFSRDGDLIESQSPTSSLTDSDRWTSSTSGLMKTQEISELKHSQFPSILEDSPDRVDSSPSSPKEELALPGLPSKSCFANIVTSLLAEKNDDSKLSASSSFEVSDEDKHWTTSVGDSGLPSSGRSSRGLDDCESPVNVPQISTEGEDKNSTKEDCDTVPDVLISSDISVKNINDRTLSDAIEHSDPVFSSHLVLSGNKNKESDVLTTTPVQCSSSSDNTSRPSSEMSSTLLVSSPWPSLPDIKTESFSDEDSIKYNSEPLQTNEQIINIGDNLESPKVSVSDTSVGTPVVPPPAKVIESIDKVIESLEKIMEPLEAFVDTDSVQKDNEVLCCDKEKLLQQYQALKSLTNQMMMIGVCLEIGTESQYLSLTHNERSALQCRIVRQALGTYHSQLANDEIHFELKTCLGTEVQKLEDLLDLSSDSEKLSTVVTQMTLLLKYQSELGEQLRQLSSSQEPLSCHQLCEVVMRRVRGLELLVRRNTKELAEIKKHTVKQK